MAEPDNSRHLAQPAARVSAARLALAVRKLREEKESLDLIGSDPIAIVGMGCRFPGGADSPEKFWTALAEGRDCVREIPAGRWTDADTLPAEMRRGGYIEDIEGFDAAYFGISPREAANLDPQHRLLLEVAWEALWDAGIEPGSLAGTDAGVFAAIYSSDYARLHSRDRSQLTAHAGTGASHSVAAGRISFLLNIQGPSLALDSACSSSLVAIHLACQSLRTRECGLAIVAASSLKLLSDEVLVFSKWGMLSSDGKCKTFDAGADGFAPGEGAGVLILKRLSDALQDGDRVRAVIRGTAVNHDGRTTVLTAPNGLAQEAVLRAALRNAMLEPREVTYIETHGTGTSLGDPIEMEAVANVYGAAGDAPACMLGAVKTNLGHLEASAGMAGLIKAVLCLEQGAIPKNLHFEKLNPAISLAGSRFRIPTENVSWVRSSQPRVAGVSSFGLGGTNGHIIVEEAPLLPARNSGEGRRIPLAAHRWQRQHFPTAPPTIAKIDLPAAMSTKDFVHPLLGRRVESPFVQGALFESDLNTGAVPYLQEHRLGDRALMPFAAFLEIAAAAARETQKTTQTTIRNFAMCEPRFVSAARCGLQVLAQQSSIEIASETEAGWRTNAKGSFEAAQIAAENIDLAALRARCNQPVPAADVYRRLDRTGLHYGASFRTIQSAWFGKENAGEALVHLRLPESLRSEAARYGMHPTLLDGCLQAVAIASGETSGELFLSISVDRFELCKLGAAELWAYAKIVSRSQEAISADLTIADATGAVVARLAGFTAKRTNVQQVGALANPSSAAALTYEIAWRAVPLNTQSAIGAGESMQADARWLLVESEPGNCSALKDLLIARGAICEVIRAPELFAASANHPAYSGVVFDARGISFTRDSQWEHPEKKAIEFLLNFVRGLASSNATVPRLWVVCSSAMAVLAGEDVAIAQAPLLGLVRTLALEYPETAASFIDAGPWNPGVERTLAEEISSGGFEPVVAFRNGTRYLARIAHPGPAEHKRLQFASSGRLEDLRLETATRLDPEPHEVEIQVRSAGLNFRDVLTALGMFPARSATPGAECSGTIVRVGSAVSGWKTGDDVLAFAPGGLQSFVNVPADFIAPKPAAMTFAEAAGIPIAFLTAHYGLARLAKLSAGQTILIHAAAGGLGLAAVQLAMRIGATVFATVGNPEKRSFLKQLGVEHVFDSRSLAFREQILEATGGAGVNVVLNSLSGDFVRASFDVIARNGCFLEVAKRGMWSDAEVAALEKNIRYFPFDLGDVAMEDPSQIGAMLRELMARFGTGELRPLPTAIYGFENATEAFRTMAQARQIGKIVLGVNAREPLAPVRELISGGAVLIVGGLGALGLETARWLAEQGASKIILAGRNAQRDAQHAIIAELRAQGVTVAIERVDVTSFDETRQLLDRIRATGPALRAVFHAAGVVEDSVLRNESWSSYREATAAKIQGAWNLHRLTENNPVALMVFFSSAASIFGSPGQGSYAAGNAFLDALAQHRASRGMRTLSVNWGAWASAGMAARLSPELAARFARQGLRPMAAAAALAALQSATESGSSQAVILDLDWLRFLSKPARPDAALFAELDRLGVGEVQRDGPAETDTADGILERIRTAAPLDRKIILTEHVKVCARRVLGLENAAAIQDHVPLQDVGLDSLMALEMRNELAQSLAISLTAGLLFDYPSVGQLTQHLLQILDIRDAAEARSAEAVQSGAEINWKALHGTSGRPIALPTYPFIAARGLTLLPAQAGPATDPASNSIANSFYEVEWIAVQAEQAQEQSIVGTCLLCGDSAALPELRMTFEQHGISCVIVERDKNGALDTSAALRATNGSRTASIHDCVYVASAVAEDLLRLNPDRLMELEAESLGECLQLVQSLLQINRDKAPRLWIVTKGAQGPVMSNVPHSALWGFGRSVAAEHPELRVMRIDLDPAGDSNTEDLLRCMRSAGAENELAIRDGELYAPRLRAVSVSPESNALPHMDESNLRLQKKKQPLWLPQIENAAPAHRRDLLLRLLSERVQATLGLNATQEIGPEQPLQELGLGSLLSIELRNVLSACLNRSLPVTLVFNYPTLNALADFILRQFPADVSVDAGRQAMEPSMSSPASLVDEIVELLGDLRSKNVALSLDGDALKCSAPPGVLTKELREELAARKPEIIAFLRASREASRVGDPGIPRIERSGPLPLSFAQQRLWFLNQLDPDSPVYNINVPLRMRGSLDAAALERALFEIVQRHEDLRTSFVVVDGVPQTAIGDGRNWRLEISDVGHLADGGNDSELLQFVLRDASEVFDITRGPLFRAHLMIVGPDDHILALTMHHIISDGWSFGVLVHEFTQLYEGYIEGREPKMIPLTIQYVDFAAWQRTWLESGELDRQLPYWKKQLAGSPPVLGFPADRRRRSGEVPSGARLKLDLPKDLIRGLEQLSQTHSVTLFMTLLAAFNVLLARYTGQDDIVVGSPSANRSRAELHPLIGFFVNNLVLRTDLSGNPTFVELLGRVREVSLRAYEHQDVPFDMLVHALRPERSLDHSPLFQVMFALQNFAVEDVRLSGLVTTPIEIEVTSARFDITVEVFARPGQMHAFFNYNADLYDRQTIERIQQHYLAILNAVLADPSQSVSSISLLSQEERRKLLVEWNQTEAPIPNLCFHQEFEVQARAMPERVAVIAGESSLTYGELNARADRIAVALQARGAGPETLVALCIERSADLIAGILGVAKSGAAYIPLDPGYPKGRIANIFEDAKPLVALTTRNLLPLLPAEGMEVLCLEDIDSAQSTATPAASVSQENLAYVIFTSGSTGRPKGVQITHRALVNFLESMRREPGFSSADVLLAVTTVSFDIAALELLLPLYVGATVCIAVEPGNPAVLLADIERYRPTVMQATPATWKLLIAAGWKGNAKLKILCGGEALDTDLARSLLVRSDSLWNMYGPTETTIWSAVLRVEEAGFSAIPIGRPIQNTSFYVLDTGGKPVPQGAAGELWIGGAGLARGYLNRPDLTAERFVPSPFSPDSGALLYRTGDQVRYRPDGTLDFFGRMDHQVKFRGFRIELGEIENALRGCFNVLDAVTLLREDDGDKRLVAYLVCAEGARPAVSAVREQLRATLPEYMIPGALVFLQELPRLPNGKLDRAALPAPERSTGERKSSFDAPATTLQQTVAAVFRDVIGVEQVGLDDNFFDLGAHSLQIVKVHGELSRNIDTKIPLVSFFQYPTIRSLTKFMEQYSRNGTRGAQNATSEISQVRVV